MKILTSFIMMLLLCASLALSVSGIEDEYQTGSERVMNPPARERVGIMVTNYGTPSNLPTASSVKPLYFMRQSARTMPSLEQYPYLYYITADRVAYLGLPPVFETKITSVLPMNVVVQPNTYRVAYPSPEQTTRWQTISQNTPWISEMPQAPYYVMPMRKYSEGFNPIPYTYSYREYTDAIGGFD